MNLLVDMYEMLIFDSEDEYEEYIAECTHCIECNSQDHVAFNNRGVAYLELGQYDSALQDFEKAVQLAPKERCPIKGIGATRSALGDLKGALAAYTALIELLPKDSYGYARRAEIYLKMGEGEYAEKDEKMVKKLRNKALE